MRRDGVLRGRHPHCGVRLQACALVSAHRSAATFVEPSLPVGQGGRDSDHDPHVRPNRPAGYGAEGARSAASKQSAVVTVNHSSLRSAYSCPLDAQELGGRLVTYCALSSICRVASTLNSKSMTDTFEFRPANALQLAFLLRDAARDDELLGRYSSTPLHSTPLHSTPLHSTPLHSTPLHSTPLHVRALRSARARNTHGVLRLPCIEPACPACTPKHTPIPQRTHLRRLLCRVALCSEVRRE
jgi:hypothetical protein